MRMLDLFMASRRKTAAVAKERLQILVAHDRGERNAPSFLPLLQREILEVVCKYVPVEQKDISMTIDREHNCEILGLSVVLPEHSRSAPPRL
jgi:cell division topological specificity factor